MDELCTPSRGTCHMRDGVAIRFDERGPSLLVNQSGTHIALWAAVVQKPQSSDGIGGRQMRWWQEATTKGSDDRSVVCLFTGCHISCQITQSYLTMCSPAPGRRSFLVGCAPGISGLTRTDRIRRIIRGSIIYSITVFGFFSQPRLRPTRSLLADNPFQ